MSWKKNAFSCLMWLLYLVLAGTAMISAGGVICGSMGMAAYFSAVYLLFAGGVVFVLQRVAGRRGTDSRQGSPGISCPAWVEGVFVFVLFAAGLSMRVAGLRSGLPEASRGAGYLELAYISADGRGISPVWHGAVGLYIRVLRLCFMLLGNKAAVAVWLQSVLQMWGVCVLYFAVRKMAGRIPAVMTAAFFMLSPFTVRRSLECSPEMLFLLFFSLVILFLSNGVESASGLGYWVVAGALTAVLGYLDAAGLLLLPLLSGVLMMRRDGERKVGRGLCGCLTGLLAGATGCLALDAQVRGTTVSRCIDEWTKLYRPGSLRFSITSAGADVAWTFLPLACLMVWGIFSFWCGRWAERFSMWIFGLCAVVFMQCLGVFTDEMGGGCYILFFGAVLAGLGIGESLTVCARDTSEGTMKEKNGAAQEERGLDNDKMEILDLDQTVEGEGMEDIVGMGRMDGADPAGGVEAAREETPDAAAGGAEVVGKEVPGGAAGGAEVAREEVSDAAEQPGRRKIEFLENPLPLPKKHERRVMDYRLDPGQDLGGYDISVADDDDFDH